jgi:hypothetical protein
VIYFYDSPFGQIDPGSSLTCRGACLGYEYDVVKLPIHDIRSLAIVVTPYRLAAGYLPYDVELTWGGACCGDSTTFSKMNSTISLGYINANGQPAYFPSYFSFGGDTGESANNLAVSSFNSNAAQIAIGNEDNSMIALNDSS